MDDSQLPQDATVFTVDVTRDFTFELKRRTSNEPSPLSGGSRNAETTKKKGRRPGTLRALIEGASETRFGRRLNITSSDVRFTGAMLYSGGQMSIAEKNTPTTKSLTSERGRDLGNVFVATNIAGYGENTVVVTNVGIEVQHRAKTKSLSWTDVAWWTEDDLALMISTNVDQSLAIPVTQIPAEAKDRIIESLRRPAPRES